MAGSITIARHGEPALSRKVKLTPAQYAEFWARYEIGGLLPDQTTPAHLAEESKAATIVYVSTRRRAQESARILIGQRNMIEDVRLIEAPLPPPPFPSWLKLSPKLWGFFARFWWWWFNHHGGQETRAQATLRAREMAKIFSDHADAGEHVLVVAHGFFNAMLGLELLRLGWGRVWGRGYKYWSTRRFERR
jgi:broad specificity phosphatase PhoE